MKEVFDTCSSLILLFSGVLPPAAFSAQDYYLPLPLPSSCQGLFIFSAVKTLRFAEKLLSTTADIFCWWTTEQEGRWPVKITLSAVFWNRFIFAWGGIISWLPKFKISSKWFKVKIEPLLSSAPIDIGNCFRVWSKPTKFCSILSDVSRLWSWFLVSARSSFPCAYVVRGA